jgi:KRAB domain-containing zinc finger protein
MLVRNPVSVSSTKHFVHKSYLMKHEIIHTGKKPYKCNQCAKTFGWKSQLTKQNIHTGEKPCQCNQFGNSLALSHNSPSTREFSLRRSHISVINVEKFLVGSHTTVAIRPLTVEEPH